MALFFQSKNFSGTPISYTSSISNLGAYVGRFSSLKFQAPYFLIAYDQTLYRGNSIIIANDVIDLGKYEFDKKIRSFQIYYRPTPEVVYARSSDATCSFNSVKGSSRFSCSGFFISPTGYIATASHCVLSSTFNATTQRYNPLESFYVAVSNKNGVAGAHEYMEARLVGYDVVCDVAVLKVDGLTSQKYLSWGNSRRTPIGAQAYVLGNPQGNDEDSFAVGVVRDNKYSGQFPEVIMESLLIDTTIISGNSGGPILDTMGMVIGLSNYGIGSTNQFGGGVSQYLAQPIITRIMEYDLAGRPTRDGYNASNASYTVPPVGSTTYRYILNDGSYNTGSMGGTFLQIAPYMAFEWLDGAYTSGDGILLIDMSSGGPLATAGFAVGDVILSIDNVLMGRFDNQYSPYSVLYNKLPGDTVTVKYYKISESLSTLRTITLTLGRAPNNNDYNTVLFSEKLPNYQQTIREALPPKA